VFTTADAADGGPVRSFYEQGHFQCFTPLLFALIDINGDVYPCCHLYRDNHGRDRSTRDWRDQHRMGNIRDEPFDAVWNGTRYAKERKDLEVISPTDDFAPCAECTRHCQQNKVLSHVMSVAANPDVVDRLVYRGEPGDGYRGEPGDGPIWL
jgi:MoaA/NifB/PqqE/SkfB family radical SAM enzyme